VFGLGAATRIYLAVGATDVRKGFEGLYGLVREVLQLEPRSGHLFLFSNQARNRLKDTVLRWQRTMGLRQDKRFTMPAKVYFGVLIRIIHILGRLLKCSDRTEGYGTSCLSECQTTRQVFTCGGTRIRSSFRRHGTGQILHL